MKNNGLLIFSTICFLSVIFSKSENNFKIVVGFIYAVNLAYYIYLIKNKK